jgi:hypothetical protein
MECKLMGDDMGEAGLGDDDAIVDGRLTGPFGEVIQTDGESTKPFEFRKHLAKSRLDEDTGLGNERDEIQLEVTLTPTAPRVFTLQSTKQTLVAQQRAAAAGSDGMAARRPEVDNAHPSGDTRPAWSPRSRSASTIPPRPQRP